MLSSEFNFHKSWLAMFYITAVVLLSALSIVDAQDVPNSWPHNYTGIPLGDFSPQWQSYFEVTDPLPNVTATLPRSFAGSISTNRTGHANDSLFFWGFEKENGSLTAADGELINDPWLIWLNGGPGASSFLGFFLENGPLQVKPDYSIVQNNYSWSKQLDAFWLDQPVGTGFSTADSQGGYVESQEQMAEDFLGFLSNLVKVFPSLAKRPFLLTGESYAGRYIPYIARAIFSSRTPPVKLRKLAIGDGAIGSFAGYEELPTVSVLETYPQIINFDTDVYNYFKTQEHLCKYDLNLTYPQLGHFPSLIDPRQTSNTSSSLSERKAKSAKSSWYSNIAQKFAEHSHNSNPRATSRDINKRRQQWKRDLIDRPNGTLDPYYGCFLWEEMTDYAVNFSFPWTNGYFDPYFIPDALNPEVSPDPSVFMNDNRTRTALHAPTSKDWAEIINYPWGSTFDQLPGANEFGDPSVESAAFFTELATNASAHNVSIIIYSGNDDALVAHLGSEVVIQNTTFGGIQGFTRRPSTPWYGDDGSFAGIVHQERNLTYVFFLGAGHEVPEYQPANAYVFLREYVIGSNTTGLVLPNSTVVVGGEDPEYAGDIIPGTPVIFYGSSTTASSTVAPSASLASWASFLATATATKG